MLRQRACGEMPIIQYSNFPFKSKSAMKYSRADDVMLRQRACGEMPIIQYSNFPFRSESVMK